MKKLIHRFLGVVVAAALLVGTAMPNVAVMAAGIRTEKAIEVTDDCKYTITLKKPTGTGVTVDAGATYGAYQVFSGKVKGDPTKDNEENPGETNKPLPITDIKWGNAFGDVDSPAWRINIVTFAIALGAANNEANDYQYAFADFHGFGIGEKTALVEKNTTGEIILNKSYINEDIEIKSTTNDDDVLKKVKYDKLAVAVAQEIENHKDRVWLQAFSDILGGYTKGSDVKGYVTQYYASKKNEDDGTYEIKVPAGYYMIIDRTEIGATATNEAYSARMLFVANNITQELKEDIPKLDKKIERDSAEYTTEVAGVGDVVDFKLTGTLPSNYDNYLGGYKYIFKDTLSDGLTFKKDSVKVTAKGLFKWVADASGDSGKWQWNKDATVEITETFDSTAAVGTDLAAHEYHLNEDTGNYKVEFTTDDNGMTVTFKCLKEMVIKDVDGTKYRLGYYYDSLSSTGVSSEIYVNYSAVVNEKAKIKDGNTNTATLEYSNDPQAYDNTDNTPEKVTHVYTFGLDIIKVNAAEFLRNGIEGDDVKLGGAKFVLLRQSGGGYEIAQFSKSSGTYAVTKWVSLTGSGADLQAQIDDYMNTKAAPGDIYEVESESDGSIKISGLDAGVTYTMVETKTPGTTDGQYAKINPFNITLEAKKDSSSEYNGTLSNATSDQDVKDGESFSLTKYVDITDPTGGTDNGDDGKAGMLVANFEYENLPSTGGIGIYPFYIIGGIVVAGSIILFALSRRKKTA